MKNESSWNYKDIILIGEESAINNLIKKFQEA